MYESITYETPVAGIVEIMQYREDTNKFSKDYNTSLKNKGVRA